jgi:hypothetical protein
LKGDFKLASELLTKVKRVDLWKDARERGLNLKKLVGVPPAFPEELRRKFDLVSNHLVAESNLKRRAQAAYALSSIWGGSYNGPWELLGETLILRNFQTRRIPWNRFVKGEPTRQWTTAWHLGHQDSFVHRAFGLLRCEVVLQKPVDENVAPADFAQEDALSGAIEEAGVAPGSIAVAPEYVAQGEVLDNRPSAAKK